MVVQSTPLSKAPLADDPDREQEETQSIHKPQLFDDSSIGSELPNRDEARQQLSGYNPNEEFLVTEEHRFRQDQEETTQRPTSEKPTIRLGIILLMVGSVFGSFAMIWAAFFAPKAPAPQLAQTPRPTPSTIPPTSDEVQGLKSKLAFQDQKNLVDQAARKPTPKVSPTPTPAAKSAPSISPSPPAASRPINSSPPVRSPSPPVAPLPVRATPINAVSARSLPAPDPDTQWRKLAALGQARSSTISENGSETQPATASDERSIELSNPLPPIPPNSTEIRSPTLTIGTTTDLLTPVQIGRSVNSLNVPIATPGEVGILNQTEATESSTSTGTEAPIAKRSVKTVTLGSTAEATVAVPLVWTEPKFANSRNIETAANRFAITLTTPLLADDGAVALPAGSVVIAEATTSNASNHLVMAQPIAVVYKDANGMTHQEALPLDSLTIMGETAQPLIAQGLNDPGSAIAQQDVLVGLLSSAERAAEIVNQPITQTSTNTNNGQFDQQTTTTRNPQPNVLAAALEGFFKPTANRIATRSNAATEELLNRQNIIVIPKNQKASIVVQRPLQIRLSTSP